MDHVGSEPAVQTVRRQLDTQQPVTPEGGGEGDSLHGLVHEVHVEHEVAEAVVDHRSAVALHALYPVRMSADDEVGARVDQTPTDSTLYRIHEMCVLRAPVRHHDDHVDPPTELADSSEHATQVRVVQWPGPRRHPDRQGTRPPGSGAWGLADRVEPE